MTTINRLAQALGYVKLAKQSLDLAPTAEFYEAYVLEKLGEVESALITGITDIAKGGDTTAPAPRQLTRDDGIFRTTPERKAAARARVQAQRQKTRDDIIEMAKRDIEVLKNSADKRHYKVDFYRCFADFIINREKRTVVALLRGAGSKKVFARGIAKCHPDDCFNAHIGRAIALRRALGLEVPAEYLNAPQPTEVRVGDVVKIDTPVSVYTRKIASITERYCNYADGGFDAKHIVFNYGKVIDDTRE
jgi:hypothetical protein